jgi:hypothetical protein
VVLGDSPGKLIVTVVVKTWSSVPVNVPLLLRTNSAVTSSDWLTSSVTPDSIPVPHKLA